MLMVSLRQIRVRAFANPKRASSGALSNPAERKKFILFLSLAGLFMIALGGCSGMATGPCQRAYEPIRFEGSPSASDVLEFAVAVAYVVLRIVVPESYSH